MKLILSVVLSALVLAWGITSSPAWAQSALERLEQQIRQRTTPPDNPWSDAAKPATAPKPEAPRARGNVEPGYLGVLADDQKDRGRGVRLTEIYRGSPAEKGGLRQEDLVTAVAGVRVRQMTDMADILSTFGPGQSIEFDVLREGKQQKVQVVLGPRPAAERLASPAEAVPLPPGEALPEPPPRRADKGDDQRSIPPPPEPTPKLQEVIEALGSRLQPPRATEGPPTDAARITQLQRRVEELERRVAELERAMAESSKKQP
jgi:hypothetical protein